MAIENNRPEPPIDTEESVFPANPKTHFQYGQGRLPHGRFCRKFSSEIKAAIRTCFNQLGSVTRVINPLAARDREFSRYKRHVVHTSGIGNRIFEIDKINAAGELSVFDVERHSVLHLEQMR
jgi:hypothetical protein